MENDEDIYFAFYRHLTKQRFSKETKENITIDQTNIFIGEDKRFIFDIKNLWNDCGNYYVLKEEHLSEKYFEQSKKRITGSIVSKCIGNCNKFKNTKITKENIEFMKMGNLFEDSIRNFYEEIFKYDVVRSNFAVPKWEPRIGGSPDGLVKEEGMIEIKNSFNEYHSLQQIMLNESSPEELKGNLFLRDPGLMKDNKNHIWINHFEQMQMYMAIFERIWCDYIVYFPYHGKYYIERVAFDPKYWCTILYPKIIKCLENYEGREI